MQSRSVFVWFKPDNLENLFALPFCIFGIGLHRRSCVHTWRFETSHHHLSCVCANPGGFEVAGFKRTGVALLHRCSQQPLLSILYMDRSPFHLGLWTSQTIQVFHHWCSLFRSATIGPAMHGASVLMDGAAPPPRGSTTREVRPLAHGSCVQ